MIRFCSPLDGTIFHTVGSENGEKVFQVEGSRGAVRFSLNGKACDSNRLILPVGDSEVQATDESGQTAVIHVSRVHTPSKVYRISVDDNIWWLQDLAQRGYSSIFDTPFLAMYRRLHDEYGICAHFNIYNECPEHGGFQLSNLSDRYKEEFLKNRDWLRLSFHAKANLPNDPYSSASYEQLYSECRQVMDEIRRFAGSVDAVTTLHWANATKDGIRALYDCGVRALLGDFAHNPDTGEEWLCYTADHEQFENVRKNVFWRDPETGMIFFPCDVVLNTMLPEEIRKQMDALRDSWPPRNFVDILIHEQYFYRDYGLYEPDYEQRIRAGIEWCENNGYCPGLVSDVLGSQLH